jgi:hypothetical protein
MTELDINFLAHQLERALTETAALRADVAVLMATTARLESITAAVLLELQAMNRRRNEPRSQAWSPADPIEAVLRALVEVYCTDDVAFAGDEPT